MKFRPLTKFPQCNAGDTVRVKLSKIDRSKGDPYIALRLYLLAVINITWK